MARTPRLTFAAVQATLRDDHACVIFRTSEPGEFRVRLTESPVRHGYYTTDLEDALRTGIAMRAEANRKARGQRADHVTHACPAPPGPWWAGCSERQARRRTRRTRP